MATLPTYMSHTVAPGNATGLARNTLPYLQFVGYPCRNEPIAGQQPVTVKPKITSFRPNPLTVGVNPPNGQLTINGSAFGTNPTVQLPSGVSSSGQVSTDTKIVLSGVSVAATATVGNNNLTVTVNSVAE